MPEISQPEAVESGEEPILSAMASLAEDDEIANIERESEEQVQYSRRALRISLLLGASLGLVLVIWALLGPHLGGQAQLIFGLLLAFEATSMGFILAIYSRQTYVQPAEANLARLRDLALRLRESSIRDSLTGLYNHGHLLTRLQQEISRARRNRDLLSVVILDLNEFKEINDRYGHLAGNETLQLVAIAIQQCVREYDVVARYGGDEFCLILPGTDAVGASAVTQKIRETIARQAEQFEGNVSEPVTFGSGTATYPDDGTTGQSLIAAADAQLYQEKQRSRLQRAIVGDGLVQQLFHRISSVVSRPGDAKERLASLVEVICLSVNLRSTALIWQGDNIPRLAAYYSSDPELTSVFRQVFRNSATSIDMIPGVRAARQNEVVTIEKLTPEHAIPAELAAQLPEGLWAQWTPIYLEGRPAAVLCMIGMKDEVSPPDPGVARALGRLIGSAMQTCLKEDEVRRQHKNLQSIAHVGSVLSRSGPLRRRLEQAAGCLAAGAGIGAVTILTRNPNDQRPFLISDADPENEESRRAWSHYLTDEPAEFTQYLNEEASTLRGPLVIDEPAEHPASPPALQELYRRCEIRSLLIVPLQSEEGSVGMLALFSTGASTFDAETVALYHTIARQIANSTQVAILLHQVQASHEQLQQNHIDAMICLAAIAEARDPLTGGHLHRVRVLTEAIARRMGLSEREVATLGHASVVHDIGKLRIPDEIVSKPGALSEVEWELIRLHPVFGEEILDNNHTFQQARQVTRSHHERWDGTGYPDGLKGEEIPLSARIVSVADVYDALTSDRPYRKAWPADKAVSYIREQRGKQFAPDAADAFLLLTADGTIETMPDEECDAQEQPPSASGEQHAA